MQTSHTSAAVPVLVGLLLVGVFVADVLLPAGIVVWVFYIAPVTIAVLTARPVLPLGSAAIAAGLITTAYFWSPGVIEGFDSRLILLNRSFGAATLLAVGALGRLFVLNRVATEHQSWVRAGQAELAQRMQGELGVDELSRRVLQSLATATHAVAGALFAREDDGTWTRRAGYALDPALHHGKRVQAGEGLVGQVAQSGEAIHVTAVPAGYIGMSSGTGQAPAGELLVLPARTASQVVGVIELAFASAMPPRARDLLEATGDGVAVALRSAFYRERLQQLLAQTQDQAARLQTQQEELRVTNEELQQQAQALRNSQERLEAQQSELEETNAQLEQQASELEHQKSALTQSEARLEQKAEELERANRYKSEFLANMSHELRTPLNSSLILAKILADNGQGNLTPDQVRAAQTIYGAGNDLLALINDILDLSKIEAGRVELRVEPVNLGSLLERLRMTFAPLAEERGLGLEFVLDPGSPESIRTDAQRLEQVLRNLLSNALKFTEQGRVTLAARPGPGDRLEFAVTDTGVGIPGDKLGVIFEAFRQADGTTSRRFGGTGLGLSISRELAALLGGDIRVTSTPGQGSTFTLAVATHLSPRAKPERTSGVTPPPFQPPRAEWPPAQREEPGRSPADVPANADSEESAPSTRTILIVEDDVAFAGIVRDTARDLGFEALVAPNATTMWQLLARHTPQGIVLDLGLPDASGLTLLEQLKRTPRTRHIPVHICSAHDFVLPALERGAVGYAVKPVRREDLLSALQRIEQKAQQSEHRVLLVEDDPDQQQALKQLLAADRVQITAVASAAEALELLRTNTFDCVVTDLGLPDMSGTELLEQMAVDEAYSFPPVIVYTGRDLTPEEEQVLRRYSRSIIIKGAKSPDRLLDEVTLFLHHVEARLPPERRRMLQAARARDEQLDGRRVLLVEDDVRNIFALTSVLEPAGVQLEIARNGLEALAAVERSRFDLVLMDVMMPEMDGLTATREIRKRPELTQLPIIAITAKAMEHDRRACLEAGANDYIAKPLDIEKLLSLIRVWLSRQ